MTITAPTIAIPFAKVHVTRNVIRTRKNRIAWRKCEVVNEVGMSKSCTFYLNERTKECLAVMARKCGMSQSEIVERCLEAHMMTMQKKMFK